MRITEEINYIFALVKQTKKPLVKIFPDGRVIGTDESFASLNIITNNNADYTIPCPFILDSREINAFMREINPNYCILDFPYQIITTTIRDETLTLQNHIELTYRFDELYNKVVGQELTKPILYIEEDIQNSIPGMFSLKAADGAKMFNVNKQFLMTSFNAIHPVTKSDRVTLIIRDSDEYSYTAEFIIHKKKEKYELHEILRFRKL